MTNNSRFTNFINAIKNGYTAIFTHGKTQVVVYWPQDEVFAFSVDTFLLNDLVGTDVHHEDQYMSALRHMWQNWQWKLTR